MVMEQSGSRVPSTLKGQGLCKTYFRKGRESAQYFNAVNPCCIELVPGELTVLMGRSGSGKSTLLNMLAGLLAPSEGTVVYGDTDLYQMDDARLSRFRNSTFGIVPQGHTPLQSLTVVQNVMLPLTLYGSASDAEPRALELLERVGIAGLADSYPKELSGGELRRMALARALMGSPAVVFADEPTGDLDDHNTAQVLSLLRTVADEGASVLMVTHEQAASDVADHVRRMDAGVLD